MNNLSIQAIIAQAQIEEERKRIKPKDFIEPEFFEALKKRNSSFVSTEDQVIDMYEGWQMAKGYYKIK